MYCMQSRYDIIIISEIIIHTNDKDDDDDDYDDDYYYYDYDYYYCYCNVYNIIDSVDHDEVWIVDRCDRLRDMDGVLFSMSLEKWSLVPLLVSIIYLFRRCFFRATISPLKKFM